MRARMRMTRRKRLAQRKTMSSNDLDSELEHFAGVLQIPLSRAMYSNMISHPFLFLFTDARSTLDCFLAYEHRVDQRRAVHLNLMVLLTEISIA